MIRLTDILKQILLEEKKKADRCLRIARRKNPKSSAYRSGNIERCRQGDIWKDLKESNKNSQLDVINNIFDSNQELSNIGTPERYAKYLNTIFPNSKVKDIVYHGAMEQLLPKDGKFKGYITYFTDVKNYAETVGFPVNRKTISAIINIKNPFYAHSELADVPEEVHLTDEYTNPRIIKKNTKGYDSVIGIDAGQKEGKTIAVFEPEQIHILGSKQDIDGFKKYVNILTEVKKETLRTWFKRKGPKGKEGGWVDCNTCKDGSCKACGRKKGEKRAKYPSCRPTPAQCKTPGKGKKWGKTK
jgi:hypothetical protein